MNSDPVNNSKKLDELIQRVDAIQQDPNFAVIVNDIGYIKRDVADIKTKMENNYVTREEFAPVKNLVYGLVGVLGIATLTAILKLVLKV